MAREQGWNDLKETIQADHLAAEQRDDWLFRPGDACGDEYRVWSTQVELLPYCGGVRCKRGRN